jgi:hypothetical protein
MAFLNLNLQLMAYQDGPAGNNPSIRLADMKWSLQGIPTDKVRQVPINLAPGETLTVASTARALSYNTLTSFQVTRQGDRTRITGNFGQRTARSSGDATTEWAMTKSGDVVRLTYTGTGQDPFLALVNVSDVVTLGDEFQAPNRGDYTILSKGSNYIEFLNPYAVEETILAFVKIFSNGPVQKGDILDISSEQFAYPNRGAFPIVRVTADFIEVINPNGFPETVSNVSSGVAAYPYTYKWLVAVVDRKVTMGLNGASPASIEIEPLAEGDLTRQPGLFVKRGKVFEVKVTNPGLSQAEGFLLLAE